MIKIYKSLIDGTLERLETIEKNCWIDLVAPTLEEIDEVSSLTGVEKELMLKMLDEEEIPRIEVEDNSTLIVLDTPIIEEKSKYFTLPLGIIFTKKDYFITISSRRGWGMTNGTISAKILCDLINNKKNKYEKVFDPTRNINLNQVKNFISNTLISNIKAYGLNLIKKNPSWYKDKAFVTKIDGKRVGIYFDNNGNKHVVSNICPHLKCFLTFNEVDKTWDCPCHGSRFDVDGNIIKSPSINGISTDNKE